MKFTKMNGTGNDYVYIDCTSESVDDPAGASKIMSNRHYGVGSDGLILIKKGDTTPYKMEMYNADGSRAKMCGNGLRCVAKYIYDEYMRDDLFFDIETDAGIKQVEITKTSNDNKAELIRINMGEPLLNAEDVPVIWKKAKQVINEKLPVHGHYLKFTALSMGNPHCVVFIDDETGLANLNIKHYATEIENLNIFPDGVNVEFIFIKNDSEIVQRTWERGSGETLACGTGACASVIAGILNGDLDRNKTITSRLKGGNLYIHWADADNSVYLEGDAVRVFDGYWLLNRF